jgi:hypothetical protein
MSFQGHIENGVVVFDEPVAIPEGTAVRVEAIAPLQQDKDTGCFAQLPLTGPLDAESKAELRKLMSQEQYEALITIIDNGGPDVDVIRKLRAASMT